jgi:enoyl-CoA hydratase
VAERARLVRDGDLGVLVIDHPPLNLFDAQMVSDILAGLDQAGDCRALLVRAEGRYFTGGVDVNEFKGLSESDGARLTADLLAITHRIETLPFPTLASVHGLCLTAGLELSLACDMIWAAESAQFGLVEAVIGLTPLMGGTQRIAERAGPARARELVMSGGLYDAATLERWNVVNRVLPDAELAQKSLRFAQRLAAGPTKRPPRHEAHRARVPGARCARRRRRDRRDRGAAVRDGRPTAGGGELPGGRARKGDVQGLLTPFRRPPLVALRRQCRRKPT